MSNLLSKAFIDSDLSDTICEIMDIAVTATTGIPIPLVSGLKSLYKTSKELKEKLFYKKIFNFLNEVKDIPVTDRINFNNEISKKGEYVWEEMLLLLHDLDNINKAKICGCLLRNTILGKLSYEDFRRLTYIVNSMYYDDLNEFICNNVRFFDLNLNYKYINSGLINQYTTQVYSKSYERDRALGFAPKPEDPIDKVDYNISDLGKMLINYGKD